MTGMTTRDANQHRGSCLCGGVRYEVQGPLPPLEACHCQQCQRAQGGPLVVVAPLAAAAFRLLAGDALLGHFRSSAGKERVFCTRCGSPLFSRRDDLPDRLRLRIGTLEGPTGSVIASHAHVASKADYWPMPDDCPSAE